MKTIKKPFKAFATKMLAIPFLAILFIPQFSFADDTAVVQALITAGSAFPAGKTYNVSTSLTVNKSINLNGDVITYTGTSGCLKIMTAGLTIQNGTIQGNWTPTALYNTSGSSGMVIYADNTTVTTMTIQNLSCYGIAVSGPHNKISVTNSKIINTGYIGFYFDAETAATTGGTFSNNVVDRSAIPAASVHEGAVAIRGVGSGTAPLTTGWTITNNTFSMPLNPTDWTGECMELRATANCVVTGNTFNQSSIGTSLVRSIGTTVSNNKYTNVQLEAIEVDDSNNITCATNIITGGGLGYIFDGTVGSNGTTITGDKISGTTKDCIQSVAGTQNIKIVNATLAAGTNSKALNLTGTTGITVTGTTISGNNSAGQMAVFLTNCVGGLTINGGTITNFTKCVVYISDTTSGLTTDNVVVSGNKVSGVPTALGTYLLNGAKVGANVKVTLQ